MASQLAHTEGKLDKLGHDAFKYPIYVREAFMSKIRGRNNSNINKFSKKYGIKIECIQEGSANAHFLLTGKKSNVKKAFITITNNFKQYIIKPPREKKHRREGKQKVTKNRKRSMVVAKQYDLQQFKSCFRPSIMAVIQMYYYRKSVGTVKFWDIDRKYGFIKISNAIPIQDVFVHYKGIYKYPRNPIKNRSLTRGEPVEFAVVHCNDGRIAAVFVTGPRGQSVEGNINVLKRYIELLRMYDEQSSDDS